MYAASLPLLCTDVSLSFCDNRPRGVQYICYVGVWLGWMSEATFVDHWVLHHDGDWRIHQLLTSLFAHADFWHLLGNMVSLWAFGLIIEGKVGAIKMLAIYLGVGLSANVLESLMFAHGGSLGASTAIYGLMMLAVLWAPRNEMEVIYWFFYFVGRMTPTVQAVVGFFIAWDCVDALLLGRAFSTPVLHLLGAVLAAPIGILMLKKQWVECEGWDLLTIWKTENQ